MSIGIVDVGGGMRGIYAAGVFDTCIEENIKFDCCVGVSAGSANVIAYLAHQKGRNYTFYHDYSLRKEYMSMKNLIHTGSYINLNYIFGTLSNHDGEYPLDYDTYEASSAKMVIVAAEALTGLPKYFTRADIARDDYRVLMASSCVPGVDQPFEIDGVPYFDGGLVDPCPIQKAFDEGCDRVVLILTKPLNTLKTPGKDPALAKMIRKKYPMAAECMYRRTEKYNQSVALAKKYVQQGKVLILSPDDTLGVDTLKRDPDNMDALYHKGVEDGHAILPWLEGKTQQVIMD